MEPRVERNNSLSHLWTFDFKVEVFELESLELDGI